MTKLTVAFGDIEKAFKKGQIWKGEFTEL